MRKAHAGIVAVSLWVGACASGGSGGGTGTGGGGGGDGAGAVATGSGAETSSAPTAGTGGDGSPSGDTSSTGRARSSQTRRAILAPERLATCTPAGAGLVDAVAVPTRLASSLGGCGFRSSTEAPTADAPASLQLDVFDTITPIADLLACTPGTEPDLDFRLATYGAFTSSHISTESWEVAFAVDDGERVHVGMQLRRECQGVAASQVTETLSLELAGPGRSVTLHRCEPIRPRCGAVP